jgi:hypothetical protein
MSTRRDFMAALVAAFASPALADFIPSEEKIATFLPHPAFPTGPFCFWQETSVRGPGDEYTLLDGQVQTVFGLRGVRLSYDAAIKLETMERLFDSSSIALFICKRCFFEGPASILPWQDKLVITPEIRLKPYMPFELRLTCTKRLPEMVRIQSMFEGWLYDPQLVPKD